jgi:hypothetical protein
MNSGKNGSQLYPLAFLIHRSFSWLVLVYALFISWYCRNIPIIRNKIFVLTVIILMSMLTGITLFYAGMPACGTALYIYYWLVVPLHKAMAILLQTRSKTRYCGCLI